jgi:hypothetical protein
MANCQNLENRGRWSDLQDAYLLLRYETQQNLAFWSGAVGVIQCIDNNIHHVADYRRRLDVGIFVKDEEQVHEIATNAKML